MAMERKLCLAVFIVCISLMLFTYSMVSAQCCAGGSGSPIASGASQGVLSERQVELNTNFQFINTNKFYKRDLQAPDSVKTFESFSSTYEYFRLAYGVTKNLTMSVESGYYFKKKEVGLDENPATTYEAKGIGDLILFPRYDIINWTEEKYRTEVTLGLGFKIPLGSYNDSVGNIEPFSGQTFYVSKPAAVQLSSGANDVIFYTFLYRGFTEHNFRLFANGIYIRKGWNPNGEKLGDFGSVALFAGKSFFENIGITLQARYEWTDTMEINENILLFGRPSNYFPEATGYKKVFITPQISYSKGKFTVYAATDLPVYQFVNSSDYYTQVASQHQTTVGLSFRFFAVKSIIKGEGSSGIYYCPMHPEITSAKPNQCTKCGMDLVEKSK
jgi:hypothetical protein